MWRDGRHCHPRIDDSVELDVLKRQRARLARCRVGEDCERILEPYRAFRKIGTAVCSLRRQTETHVGLDFHGGVRWIEYPIVPVALPHSRTRRKESEFRTRWIPFHAVGKHVQFLCNFLCTELSAQRKHRQG